MSFEQTRCSGFPSIWSFGLSSSEGSTGFSAGGRRFNGPFSFASECCWRRKPSTPSRSDPGGRFIGRSSSILRMSSRGCWGCSPPSGGGGFSESNLYRPRRPQALWMTNPDRFVPRKVDRIGSVSAMMKPPCCVGSFCTWRVIGSNIAPANGERITPCNSNRS